jgi:hypothetical protein
MNHAKLHGWNVICNIACNNGFPSQLIHNLHRKVTNKCTTQTMNSNVKNGTWVTFTFHNPLVHKVTNLFKNINVNIGFRLTYTIYHQLQYHPNHEPSKPSGIYKLQCMTCNKSYVRQSGSTIAIRYKEHIRYIHTNTPTSAYALHILNQSNDYGPPRRCVAPAKALHEGKSHELLGVFLHSTVAPPKLIDR